ncbi:MAG TPA: MBL fold metallo-hydrolase [Methylomusa anaerophila]|uniref:Putative polyketide biosynthesis zinc-dependent hydrolase PksB n=1 Tax=Methylomusa anaerophila TaxID=1930071 RepID=A0A348AQW7_9FIRM|nr:MBL fold metallo-hydrolase [Methylomusa anaerophila]BBB93465.1 putative polyketide biosynthesis zinc-dependent hydrolase PksB [Methylomusa anaerophila]HML90583.1 MBL fold metallo-hydrolase [Methylomusa anaerophila]
MNSFQVYQLKLKSMFFKNYCYIIMDTATKQTAIVDPAWELDTIELLLNKINADLVMILLTHSHFDHVNLVNPLLKKYNPQVVMSAKEIDYYKFACNNLMPIAHDDLLTVGDTKIKCLLTPGHTAGSACFLLSDCLFTGDTIFIEGCGMCDANGGNPAEMYNSIQLIKNTVSPDVLIYPAHSYGKAPGYPLNYLLKENIYFQIDKREHFIAFRMRKNQNNLFTFY